MTATMTVSLHESWDRGGFALVEHIDPACAFIEHGVTPDGDDDFDRFPCRFCVEGSRDKIGRPLGGSWLDRSTNHETEENEDNNKLPTPQHEQRPAKPYETRLAEVCEWLRLLGRKVEVKDITHANKKVAGEWARRYDGTNDFVRDVAERSRHLSDPQAKGLLNCLRADVLYGPRPATGAVVPTSAPGSVDIDVLDILG